MNVLVYYQGSESPRNQGYLEAEFPELNIMAAREETEVGDFMGKAEVLNTLRLSDALMSRAGTSSGFRR
jgi:hypothetical protein